MRKVDSTKNFWLGCALIAIVIGIICLAIAQERMKDRREAYTMDVCHEVPGRDYEGCIIRAKKEYKDE